VRAAASRANDLRMSVTGKLAVSAVNDLALSLNWITGPEQAHQNSNPRTVLDFVANYTGIKKLTIGANIDYGWEEDEATLAASGTRGDPSATWAGGAGYDADDWTEALREALRLEH